MDDNFVSELQTDFINDTKSEAESFVLEVNEFSSRPNEVIHNFSKLLHNFKGNAHAVGFTNFASFFHLLESIIIPLDQKLPKDLDGPFLSVLEFYMSEVVSVIQVYCDSVGENLSDDRDLLLQKSHQLFHFKEWCCSEFNLETDFDKIYATICNDNEFLDKVDAEMQVTEVADEPNPSEPIEDDFSAQLNQALEASTEEPADELNSEGESDIGQDETSDTSGPEGPLDLGAQFPDISASESISESDDTPSQPSQPDSIVEPTKETVTPSTVPIMEGMNNTPADTKDRYLVFKNNGQQYAINADLVLEVVKKCETTLVDTKDEQSVGVLDFNSKFVEIYDIFQPLAVNWNLSLEERNFYFILVNTTNGILGFPSQDVDQVMEFNSQDFFDLSIDIHHLPIFSQIHRYNEKNILILNPEKLKAA